MKKDKYKIFGTIWDHLPELTNINTISNKEADNRYIFDYKNTFSLWDECFNEKSINLSELLSIESQITLNKIIEQISNVNTFYIKVDYFPNSISSSEIVKDFYLKRLSQISYFIENNLQNNQHLLMITDNVNLQQYYKENNNEKSI